MFYGSFRLFRSRHPAARFAKALIGLVAVFAMIALGMFAVAALAIGGGVFLLLQALRSVAGPARTAPGQTSPGQTPQPQPATAPPGVIEGEFTVVPAAPVRRRDGAH